MRIILASTSPIRKQMLSEAGFLFEVIPPICDEELVKQSLGNIPLSQKALELAKAKAKSIDLALTSNPLPNGEEEVLISEKYLGFELNKTGEGILNDTYIIGSDQICEIDGEVISKSKNFDKAFTSLKKLSGKTHTQNNGTCIYKNGECVMQHIEIAELTMRNLTDAEIIDYINLDNPIGCAGSYKFELNGKNLFSKINGSAEVIQGFSVSKIMNFFNRSF